MNRNHNKKMKIPTHWKKNHLKLYHKVREKLQINPYRKSARTSTFKIMSMSMIEEMYLNNLNSIPSHRKWKNTKWRKRNNYLQIISTRGRNYLFLFIRISATSKIANISNTITNILISQ